MKYYFILDESTYPLEKYIKKLGETLLFQPTVGWFGKDTDRIHELTAMLKQIDNDKEYVFIASSMGAFTILPFVSKNPGIISKVVLLDPSHINFFSGILTLVKSIDLPQSEKLDEFITIFTKFSDPENKYKYEIENIINLNEISLLIIAAGKDSNIDFLPVKIQKKIFDFRHNLIKEYLSLNTKGYFKIIEKSEHGIADEYPQEAFNIIKDFINNFTHD